MRPGGGDDEPNYPNPTVVPEFFGDTAVVNGKVYPVLNVEPRKYRFRLLNGSNSRFYNLQFQSCDEGTGDRTPPGSDGDTPAFTRIGTDGGYLNAPVDLDSTDRLLLPDARRHDVVDFSGFEGDSFVLLNDAESPYKGNDSGRDLPEIMLFRVGQSTTGTDDSQVPSGLGSVPDLSDNTIDQERYLTLDEETDSYGRLQSLLNGVGWDPASQDPSLQERPTVGDTEVWHLINRTVDTHPIHLHLVQFLVYQRRTYGTTVFENKPPSRTGQFFRRSE